MPLPSMAPLRQASMNSTLVPGTVSKMRRISRAVMPTSETPSDSSSCKSPFAMPRSHTPWVLM